MKTPLLTLLLCALPAYAHTPAEEAAICDEYADARDPHRPADSEYRLYHRPDHFERDLAACLATLERQPDNPRIAYQTAGVYLERALYLGAQKIIAEATEGRRGNPDAAAELAHAEAQADIYLRRAGDYPMARYRLARIHQNRNGQKAEYEALLTQAPALAHSALGAWYEKESENNPQALEKAREHYRLAAAAGAHDALTALVDKQAPEYIPLLREVAEKSGEPTAKLWLALALYERGDTAAADAVAEELRQCPSSNSDCAYARAVIEAEQYKTAHGKPAVSLLQNVAAAGDMSTLISNEILLDQLEQIKKQHQK